MSWHDSVYREWVLDLNPRLATYQFTALDTLLNLLVPQFRGL